MDFSHEAGEGPTPKGGIGVAAAEESRSLHRAESKLWRSLHRAEQQAMAEPALRSRRGGASAGPLHAVFLSISHTKLAKCRRRRPP